MPNGLCDGFGDGDHGLPRVPLGPRNDNREALYSFVRKLMYSARSLEYRIVWLL